jgi:glycosyltransferase involved in cell wall biosynthesis
MLLIIIPTYNRFAKLIELLRRVESIREDVSKLIILNNNSSDETNNLKIADFGYPIELTSSSLNVGLRGNLIKSYFTAISNHNFEYDFVWILSDDDHLEPILLREIVIKLRKEKSELYFLNHSVVSNGSLIKESVLSKEITTYKNIRDIFRTDGPQFMLLGSLIYRRDILEKNKKILKKLIARSEITIPFRFAMYFGKSNLIIVNHPKLFINDQSDISWKDEGKKVYRKYLLIDLFKLFLVSISFKYLVDILLYLVIRTLNRLFR